MEDVDAAVGGMTDGRRKPSTEDIVRTLALACDYEVRSDDEHESMLRVAQWLDTRRQAHGLTSALVELVRCSRDPAQLPESRRSA